MTRKITVLTGTRADYGLLRKLMQELHASKSVELQTLITGTHLLPEFGNTYHEILRDGLPISHKVDILMPDDNSAGIARTTGFAIKSFADVFEKQKPDILVVLGDRYEALAATISAYLMGIPIAHIAGGEVTSGALDDALRHSITKMSSLHFVAAEEYRTRVIQLGEIPSTVFNVGAIGLDNINEIDLMSRTELESFINFDLGEGSFFLCTIHPETATNNDVNRFFDPMRKAIAAFPEVRVIITKANADAGGRHLNELLEQFEKATPERVKVVANLGQRGYLSALEHSSVVVGNSSSGILEAPSIGTPTVNIGERQRGRLRAPSVIDVPNTRDAIISGIKRALSPELQNIAASRETPYGTPGASKAILEVITKVELEDLLPKIFFDVPPRE